MSSRAIGASCWLCLLVAGCGEDGAGTVDARAGASSSGSQNGAGGSTPGGKNAGGESSAGNAAGGKPASGEGAGGAPQPNAGSGGAEPSSGCGKAPVLSPMDAENPGWPYIDNESTRLTVNGKRREFSVYVPANYDQAKQYPLYFSFHGCGGGKSPSAYIGATAGQAIVIAAQGLSGSCGAGVTGWLREKDSEDFQFFDAMVDWAESGFCIDRDRVFAAGHSHGAWFTGQLGCSRGDVLRGIQPQAGGVVDMSNCKSQVAAMFVHHVDDGSVPVADGEAFRDQFVAANHCTQTTKPASQAPCVEYQGCDAGYPVTWCPLSGDIYWEYGKKNVDAHNAPWAWGPVGPSTVSFFSSLSPK